MTLHIYNFDSALEVQVIRKILYAHAAFVVKNKDSDIIWQYETFERIKNHFPSLMIKLHFHKTFCGH